MDLKSLTSLDNSDGQGKDNLGFYLNEEGQSCRVKTYPTQTSTSFSSGNDTDHAVTELQGEGQTNGINNDPHDSSTAQRYWSKISQPFSKAKRYCKSRGRLIKNIILAVLAAGYLAYFIAACVLNFHRAIALVVLTGLVVFFSLYDLVKKKWGKQICKCFKPVGQCFRNNLRWMRWVFIVIVLGLLVAWLVVDTSKRPEQLISFAGVCMFILLLYIFSKHPKKVSWRALFWGLGMEFALGLFIIRTNPGFVAFDWLGKQVQIFLNYTTAGSGFVFGDALINQAFAFQALPIVVFFSCVMSVLYYLGLMQWLIVKIAWIMQKTMGTSATESLSVAGNIFVGQTEAPLLIRPYLPEMTKSEIHAVMTGGFATIAGSVLGAYISFGIDASALIAASVMAAPCALALAKLSYPETEASKFKSEKEIKIDVGDEKNILEAASSGASASVSLVANIAANLIAFLALLEFMNAALRWLGGMVNYPKLTFQLICSYIFMPVAFMMGIPYEDSFIAAELIGTKLFLNEFVAYEKLSVLKKNRLNDLDKCINGELQCISVRAETICTYALCGFANFSSLGIMIGGLSSISPTRKSDIAEGVLRALFTGTCVSLVNACIAGVLFVPPSDCIRVFQNSTFSSTTPDLDSCCLDLFQSTSWINGTAGFDEAWNGVQNAAQYLLNCCNLYNSTACTAL
ncbi:sodium/nucleoside cotransporter 1 [Lepisosteus oculatus]|uniref:sodium/nucleoside cotransporter 1 n=1 Tax=Lepisosteus oculatus TaxID=7918 RepID=UPI00371E39C2